MKNEIKYKIGFADADIDSYEKKQNCLLVRVRTWNDKQLLLKFSDFVGLSDYGIGNISGLFKEDTITTLMSRITTEMYEVKPDAVPYSSFQFLNLDGEVSLEIIANDVDISEY